MVKVVCIVQARTGSTRLPGKVLKNLAGRPMLEHIIFRLKRCRKLDGLVIATTTSEKDTPVAEIARRNGVGVFRGEEDNVFSRYLCCAEEVGADVIVRVTGDCPLIDPATVDHVVDYYLHGDYDFVSAVVDEGFPRGLDTEVFSLEALRRVNAQGYDNLTKEHVIYHFHQHPESFKLGFYEAPLELRHPEWRLCVDTKEDFLLISEIYNNCYRNDEIVDIQEVVRLLERQPFLLTINAHVEQQTT